jgi:antitoxin HicB
MSKLKKVKKDLSPIEYQINITFDPRDQIYVARVPELEHCQTHGTTPEEAFSNAREAIELWIETAQEQGIEIPLPIAKRVFSGKFVVRAPEEIHAKLAKTALNKSCSMNELAVEILSEGLKSA